jgi:hypothetical protein
VGHTRLGAIPKLRRWADVVAAFVDADVSHAATPVSAVAGLTLAAAEPALRAAVDDVGVRQSFLALAKVVLAAKTDDWRTALAALGIVLPDQPSLFDLTAGVQFAIDDAVLAAGAASDVGEMAHRAAAQALTELAGLAEVNLFGPDESELQRAVAQLATKKGFADLGQRFFGHFLARFLNFYLSRVTAQAAGASETLRDIGELSRFNARLNHHCVESARIVRDFCGEWFSKTTYLEGIDEKNSARFVAVAMRKLADEVQRQRGDV